MTPTQRTLKLVKDCGMPCAMVERWIPGAQVRSDMFGCIDMVALCWREEQRANWLLAISDFAEGEKPGTPRGTIGIQSTGQDFAGHRKKLEVERRGEVLNWLCAGNDLVLVGWRKVLKKRGGKARVYRPRIKVYGFDDFPDFSPFL